MTQKSSMSLFLNCASTIVVATAKVAYVLSVFCGSMDHGLLLGLRYQHITTNWTPSCSWFMDPDEVLRCSWDHGQQHGFNRSMDRGHPTRLSPFSGRKGPASCHYGPRWQCRPPTLTWPPAAALFIDMNMVSGCSTDLGHLCGSTDPRLHTNPHVAL